MLLFEIIPHLMFMVDNKNERIPYNIRCPAEWEQLKSPMKRLIKQFETTEYFTDDQFKYINKSIEYLKTKLQDPLDNEAIINLLIPSLKQSQKEYSSIKELWTKTIKYLLEKFPDSPYYKQQVIYSISRQNNQKIKKLKEEKDIKRVPYKKIVDLFQKVLPNFTVVLTKKGELPYKTKQKIKITWLEYQNFDDWSKVFEKVKQSEFLTKKWKPDFDWIIEINNFRNILNGKYDNITNVEKSKLTNRYQKINSQNTVSLNIPNYLKKFIRDNTLYLNELRNFSNDETLIKLAVEKAKEYNFSIKD